MTKDDAEPLSLADAGDRIRFLSILLLVILLDSIFVVCWLSIVLIGASIFGWAKQRAPTAVNALEAFEWIFFAASGALVTWYLAIDTWRIATKIWDGRDDGRRQQ